MQGIFSVTFEGKKKDLEYLVRFIQEKVKSDNAYSYFEELIEYTEDFNEVGDNDSTSLVIGLEESSNISDIDTSHFEEMTYTVPSLKMIGYYSVLDEDSHTEFKSKANSTKVEFTEIDALCAKMKLTKINASLMKKPTTRTKCISAAKSTICCSKL